MKLKIKKSIFLIISLFLFVNYSVSAQKLCGADTQNNCPEEGCPPPDPSPIPPEFFDYLSNLTTSTEGEKELCLNVFFHILRDDNGKQSEDIDIKLNGTVDDIIDQLNSDYAPYQISFKKIGEDFIDDSRYVNMTTYLRYTSLFQKNVYDNAINIYLVDSAPDRGTGRIPSNTFFILKSAAISSVSSHEMGHCFGLYHTHESGKFDSEEVDKCDSTGDLICDTPPDSDMLKGWDSNGNLEYYVNSNCEYTKGDGFNPDTRNFMSYTNPDCMNRFSYEQITRVKYNILNLPVLQATLSCECSNPFIFGKSTICDGETAVYTSPCLTNINQKSINISSGLELIAFDATSITVKPIQTSRYKGGAEFIQVNIDGILYTKEIWVGEPQVQIEANISNSSNKVYLNLIGKDGTDITRQNITYIKWEHTAASNGASITEPAINQPTNIAVFNDYVSKIVVKVTVKNACGEVIIYKNVTPYPDPCYPYFFRLSGQEYNLFKTTERGGTTNPCPDIYARAEKVKDSAIFTAALFDSFANKVRDYNRNSFSIQGIQAGVYILKAQVGNELITKKIIVE